VDAVHEFVLTRLRNVFTDDFSTEVVAAVLALDQDLEDLPAAKARVEALAKRHGTPEFEPINITFKRAANILDDPAPEGGIDPARLSEDAEQALADAIGEARTALAPLIEARDFEGALEIMVGLRAPVDRFFDDVLVNDPDAATRANRHRLLRDVVAMLQRLADVRRL